MTDFVSHYLLLLGFQFFPLGVVGEMLIYLVPSIFYSFSFIFFSFLVYEKVEGKEKIKVGQQKCFVVPFLINMRWWSCGFKVCVFVALSLYNAF